MDLDYGDYLQFLLALVFVLALIGLVAALLRRFGLAGAAGLKQRIGGRERRLAVVEMTPLDARRRLVLIRRDGVEHLVLLGPTGDLVVETNIRSEDRDAQKEASSIPDRGRFADAMKALRSPRE